MGQHDPVLDAEGRQHMGGFAVQKPIETASQRLAVDGDSPKVTGRPRRRQVIRMAAKSSFQCLWINTPKDQTQRTIGRRVTQIQPEGCVQPLEMHPNEAVHLPIGIGSRQQRQHRIQKHRGKLKAPTLRTTMIGDLRKYFQQGQRHTATSDSGCWT